MFGLKKDMTYSSDQIGEQPLLSPNDSPNSQYSMENFINTNNSTQHPIDIKDNNNLRFLPAEYSEIRYFNAVLWRRILFYTSLLVFPIVPILYFWFPFLRTVVGLSEVYSYRAATHVLVNDVNNKWNRLEIVQRSIYGTVYPTFEFRKHIYIASSSAGFKRIDLKLNQIPSQLIYELRKGFTTLEANDVFVQNGLNSIDIKAESVLVLIVKKLFHPFYMFQIASVVIWFIQGYTTYAILIVAMSTLSLLYEVYSMKMDENRLRNLVKVEQRVKVRRDGTNMIIDARELVTGDAIILGTGDSVVSDIVLVQGECIVDESTLTGETVPIVKTPLSSKDQTLYALDVNKANTLFSGSRITDVRLRSGVTECIGIVTGTGFYTTKGELFRSILFPHEIDFKFNRQSYIYLGGMGILAISVFIYRLISELNGQTSFGDVVLNSLDLITITVPPALPLVLSLGIGYALNRLSKKRIFCINPQRINFAGWTNMVCLDKTGTLTEDKLEFKGADRFQNGVFSGIKAEMQPELDADKCILTCHSVNRVGNELVGQFVDQEMFRSTEWDLRQESTTLELGQGPVPVAATIQHPSGSGPIFHILKRNDFDARIQLASVITAIERKNSSSSFEFMATVKGSPEAISHVCRPDTLPKDVIKAAANHSQQGYYVLALAFKHLPQYTSLSTDQIKSIKREDLETNLTFAGFILFESRLKPESRPMLDKLSTAGIKSIIITGDNAFTTIHAARELGMVGNVLFIDTDRSGEVFFTELKSSKVENIDDLPHQPITALPSFYEQQASQYSKITFTLAVNGTALRIIKANANKKFLNWLMEHTTIFSRAKPQQKTEIVEDLIMLGYFTVMCGDGTNDCGALKAAHVGLALSDTEASIVAPFSSATKTVADIPILLSEGRCALETSFTAFKYMVIYPIVQLSYAMVSHNFSSLPANNQYLFDDIGIVIVLAQLMLLTKPTTRLSSSKPWSSLFSIPIISSIFGLALISVLFTSFSMTHLTTRSWYCDSLKAQSNLDRSFLPIDPTLPAEINYPCYKIIPERDIQFDTNVATYETTFVWLFSHFQFVFVAFALSLSYKFRRPFWTNYLLIFWLVLSFVGCSILLLMGHENPGYDNLRNGLQLRDDGAVPYNFRLELFGLVLGNAFCLLIWEGVFVPLISNNLQQHLENRWLAKRKSETVPFYGEPGA